MQITFDTDKDAIAKVLAVTHAAYGIEAKATTVTLEVDASNAVAQLGAALEVATPSAGIPIAPNDNPATGVDTLQKDKDGLPWDARVHSSPPTMNADGTWRAKRGRKDEDYAAVKAEYHPAPATPAAPPAPPAMPALPTTPAAPTVTAYTQLSDFLRDAVANQISGCSAEWVTASLTNMGVVGGDVLNLQGEPDEKLLEILAQFKAALGVA